jgi:uncharacterized protein
MNDEEQDGEHAAPVRVAADDLAPDTLRAVIESFVLREGTDYGREETSLDAKVAQVLAQVRRGEAHVVFDPGTDSVTIVMTRALDGLDAARPQPGAQLMRPPLRQNE